ncbi:MAG: diaminopimelate epimerase [Pseudomonadota bacterium]
MGQRTVTFHKMHSLGNDFMVFDAISQNVDVTPEQIRAWGDRNTGIGFDQLLLIEPPTAEDADFTYTIYNADGSSAEQCGNGTRCVALLVQHLGLLSKSDLIWQSAGGYLQTCYVSAEQIETRMTEPVLQHESIPFDPAQAEQIDEHHYRLTTHIDGLEQSFDIIPVSMGNPHAVIFAPDVLSLDVANLGANLTRHPAFPEGVNVGFCQVVDKQFVRLRVFERGVGETQACGTGACAAVVAGRLTDRLNPRAKVSLPGGKLRITWSDPAAPVTMTGNGTLVYEGKLPIG